MKRLLVLLVAFVTLFSVGVCAQNEENSTISAGGGNVYVVKKDGTLWARGEGYVGNGTSKGESVDNFIQIMSDVSSVSRSETYTAIVKKDGTLWGIGELKGMPIKGASQDPIVKKPTKLNIDNVKSVSADAVYMLVLKNDGTLWLCGYMDLPKGKTNNREFIQIASDVTAMRATTSTVFYITKDHTLWGYGSNYNGQIDFYGDRNKWYDEPVVVTENVKQIFSINMAQSNFALNGYGELIGWGNGGFCSEKVGWIERVRVPLTMYYHGKIASFSPNSTFVVTSNGDVWFWGKDYVPHDDGKSLHYLTSNVDNITLDTNSVYVLKNDGSLWASYRKNDEFFAKEVDRESLIPMTKVLENVSLEPSSYAPDSKKINDTTKLLWQRKGMSHWALDEVSAAVENQLIPKEMLDKFKEPTTREQFCVLAVKMIETIRGKNIEKIVEDAGAKIPSKGTFKDCDTLEVRAAKALGITDGTSATTFSPDALLTREQAAKFLTSTAIVCGKNVKLTPPTYADKDKIADWAKPYIGYLKTIDVMKGVGGGNFDPKGKYQRQQSFMTMYRMWQKIPVVNITINSPSLNKDNEKKEEIKQAQQFMENSSSVGSYKLKIKGEMTLDGNRDILEYDVFYKYLGDGKYVKRVDSYENDKFMNCQVYDYSEDVTKDYDENGNIRRTEGYLLPIQHFDILDFNEMKNNKHSTNFEAKVTKLNGKDVVYVKEEFGETMSYEYWIDTKYQMPVKVIFKEEGSVFKYKLDKEYTDYKVESNDFNLSAISFG